MKWLCKSLINVACDSSKTPSFGLGQQSRAAVRRLRSSTQEIFVGTSIGLIQLMVSHTVLLPFLEKGSRMDTPKSLENISPYLMEQDSSLIPQNDGVSDILLSSAG